MLFTTITLMLSNTQTTEIIHFLRFTIKNLLHTNISKYIAYAITPARTKTLAKGNDATKLAMPSITTNGNPDIDKSTPHDGKIRTKIRTSAIKIYAKVTIGITKRLDKTEYGAKDENEISITGVIPICALSDTESGSLINLGKK